MPYPDDDLDARLDAVEAELVEVADELAELVRAVVAVSEGR